jgi:hypothetical protein
MDSKVTALERAFQLARSGHMATVDDIRKRLKYEGYDERAVADGGRSLTTQLRGIIRAAGADAKPGAGPGKPRARGRPTGDRAVTSQGPGRVHSK